MKEQALEEKLTFQEQLLSKVHDAIIAVDENMIVTYWNEMAEKVLGWKTSETIGKSGHGIFRQIEVDHLFPEITEMLNTLGFYNKEMCGRRKDGTVFYADVHIKRIFDLSGTFKGTVTTLRDITDRIAYEQKLLKKEQDYLEIIDSSSDGSYIHDLEKGEIYYSTEWKKRLGIENWTPAEAVAASVTNVHPDDQERIQDIYRKAVREKAPKAQMEFRAKTKDEDYIWILGQAKIIYNEDGKPVKYFGTHADITTRKKMEEVLRESEERQAFILKLSDVLRPLSDVQAIQDSVTRMLVDHLGASQSNYTEYLEGYGVVARESLNDAAISIIGSHRLSDFPASVAILKSGRDMIIPDVAVFPAFSAEERARYLALNIHANVTIPLIKEGTLVATLTVRQATPRNWTPDDVELLREVAERTWSAVMRARTEKALRESEKLAVDRSLELEEAYRQNKNIVESIADCFYTLDKDLRFCYVNKAAEEIWGLPRAELIGRKIEDVFPDLIDISLSNFRKALEEQSPQHYEVFSRVIQRWGDMNVYPTQDGISVYFRDTTERKRAEEALQKSNEALAKSIEMKDEFLSLISHEFRTPLTVIISAIQMLKTLSWDEFSAKAKGYFDTIRLNSNRQLKLVNNILDISRINAGRFEVHITNLDILQLTNRIIESIKPYAERKKIRISFSFVPIKIITGIDEEKYERILLNLLSNAIKYTPTGKSITVSLSRKIVNNKPMACIQVSDNGIGIPADKQEHIFERFGQVDSSLSRQAEGTGIGLHLTRMFVEMLGGEIRVNSKLGAGSTFTVLIPVTKAKETYLEKTEHGIADNRTIQLTDIEFSDVYLDK